MKNITCPICGEDRLKETRKRIGKVFVVLRCEKCGLEFLSRSPESVEKCEICGYNKHPFALERHHRRNGSQIVLCGNCHNIITRTGREYALKDKEQIKFMIDALIKMLKPLNPRLLRELIVEEIEKNMPKRVDFCLKSVRKKHI